jgi:hypothetical protein
MMISIPTKSMVVVEKLELKDHQAVAYDLQVNGYSDDPRSESEFAMFFVFLYLSTYLYLYR